MDRREPLQAELPVPETVHVTAPIPEYPSELTCRVCRRLMLPLTLGDRSEWHCFPCNRRVLIVLPSEADV